MAEEDLEDLIKPLVVLLDTFSALFLNVRSYHTGTSICQASRGVLLQCTPNTVTQGFALVGPGLGGPVMPDVSKSTYNAAAYYIISIVIAHLLAILGCQCGSAFLQPGLHVGVPLRYLSFQLQ